MENYKVYMHTAPNGKVYIGITKQKLKRRWQNGSGYNKNSHFKRAIKKYGWDNFKHELLFENLSEEETRKLISINTKKAMNNKEVKEKISKSSRGRKASEETKMKMSLKRKGKPLKKINLIAINPKTLNIVKNFSSVIEALAWLKQNGINNPYCSNLYRCINGERKTAYNFIWKVI